MSRLKHILVGRPVRSIRKAYFETFGCDLPAEHRSKLANFLIWNRLSYQRPQCLIDCYVARRSAREISYDLWGGLALASADDDADYRRINAREFESRLKFLLAVVEASFSSNLDPGLKHAMPSSRFESCKLDLPVLSDLGSGDLRHLIATSAPVPHTSELYVNAFGAWLFGRALSHYINVLYHAGLSDRRLVHLVDQVATQLTVGVEGQIQSLKLLSPEPLPFSRFLSLTQSLSAPIAKILTYLRSPDHCENLRRHFKKSDPSVFQYILDDIPDLFEDCLAGKQGIVHGLMFAQLDIANLVAGAISDRKDHVEISELSALNFLLNGNWSAASNYVGTYDKSFSMSISELRPVLENRRRDKHLSINELVSARVTTGELLISSIQLRDPKSCANAVLESGILFKILSGLKRDQRRIKHIGGVTSKMVHLLPAIAALLTARCFATAWIYRLHRRNS